jgi:hypothetical protein
MLPAPHIIGGAALGTVLSFPAVARSPRQFLMPPAVWTRARGNALAVREFGLERGRPATTPVSVSPGRL